MKDRYKSCKKIKCEGLKQGKCSLGEHCKYTTQEIASKEELADLNKWLIVLAVLMIVGAVYDVFVK